MSIANILNSNWEPFDRCPSCPLFIPGPSESAGTRMKATRSRCVRLPDLDEIKSWIPGGPWVVENPSTKIKGIHDSPTKAFIKKWNGTTFVLLKAVVCNETNWGLTIARGVHDDSTPVVEEGVDICDYLFDLGYPQSEIDEFLEETRVVMNHLKLKGQLQQRLKELEVICSLAEGDAKRIEQMIPRYEMLKLHLESARDQILGTLADARKEIEVRKIQLADM